jgi:peptidoglycan hydrolase CwlO-like protein
MGIKHNIMTQEQKAERYDYLVREGDRIQFQLSKLQSQNAGINTKSEKYNEEVAKHRQGLLKLEQEMARLFM